MNHLEPVSIETIGDQIVAHYRMNINVSKYDAAFVELTDIVNRFCLHPVYVKFNIELKSRPQRINYSMNLVTFYEVNIFITTNKTFQTEIDTLAKHFDYLLGKL